MWVTIAWVILVSYPKSSEAGPAAFAACMAQAAGPVCAASAASGRIQTVNNRYCFSQGMSQIF